MSFSVRPFEADFAGVARLINTIDPEPITAQELEEAHARYTPKCRLVAVDQADSVVGYCSASPTPRQGRYYFTLLAAPEMRRRGVGSALLAALEDWARANEGTSLLTGIPDDEEEALRFARNRSFSVSGHQFESTLTLDRFDESRFAGVVDAVEQSGIRFCTFAEIPTEETERKVYELYKITDLDTPGYAGLDPADYPPFDRWREGIFGNDATLHDGVIIAMDGDQFVGVTILQREGKPGGLYTEYTGVLREYRGRKIGLALKLLSVATARAHQAEFMWTKNDATNAPMLTINEQMGYERVPGRYWIVKEL